MTTGSSHYQKAYFLLSVANINQFPPDHGIEIAIAGRSNAGKSSVINCITQNKAMARVSKTPGRTQLINVFVIDDQRRLIDLPGYGFAKVPLSVKQKWEKLVAVYLEKRKSLAGLILVMDCRHPLKPLDLALLAFCEEIQLPVHILVNKTDKLSKGATAATLKKMRTALTSYTNSVSLQGFSAFSKEGLRELHLHLNKWYQFADTR